MPLLKLPLPPTREALRFTATADMPRRAAYLRRYSAYSAGLARAPLLIIAPSAAAGRRGGSFTASSAPWRRAWLGALYHYDDEQLIEETPLSRCFIYCARASQLRGAPSRAAIAEDIAKPLKMLMARLPAASSLFMLSRRARLRAGYD